MAEVERLANELDEKLKVLYLLSEEAKLGLQRNRRRELQRHLNTIQKNLDEIYTLKDQVRVEKVKIESIVEVQSWSADLEDKLLRYEDIIEDISTSIEDIDEQKESDRHQKKVADEKALREVQNSLNEVKLNCVKLPKLTITKFNGSVTDWQRFWSQFEVEVDKSDAAPVTKFSYLKKMVDGKVRALVDGLPFTIEGYERAKNILKTTYGKVSEIVNAHIINIMELPRISGSPQKRILGFYENLIINIQPLETMGKLHEINGYVRMTLDKLPGIRSDLVRMDDDWQDWDFPRLAEAIRKWTERNPVPVCDEKRPYVHNMHNQYQQQRHQQQVTWKRDKTYTVKGSQFSCVFCGKGDHKAVNCGNVCGISERKKILSSKRLCFNCLRPSHRATECKSRNCMKCQSKHHTSICDQKDRQQENKEVMMYTAEASVTYPIIVVEINGIRCRALLDTGAGSSYVSSGLIKHLKLRPTRSEGRQIEMLLHTTTKKVELYQVDISSTTYKFNLKAEVTKVEKEVLMHVPNPGYQQMLRSYEHLGGILIEDNDKKEELPVHVVIGASEFAKIKTNEPARVGKIGEPVAELTKLGWMVMSPGSEMETKMYLTQNTSED